MEYVPLWTDILDGPNWKILDLPPEVFRFWILCLMAAQKYDYVDGYLPDERTLSAWTQIPVTSLGQLRDMAVTSHVLDYLGNGSYKVHDWEHWRDVKDKGATKRKRAERARSKGVASSVTDKSQDGHGSVTGMSQAVTPQHSTDNRHSKPVVFECEYCAHPPAPALTPDEMTSGRTGEEHALFLRVVQMLEAHEPTKFLAGQLIMAADTPGIRTLESWRLWVAAHVVQRPDRPKQWSTFESAARMATETEYERIKPRGKIIPTVTPKTDEQVRAEVVENNARIEAHREREREARRGRLRS